jgi:hypothetical protein
MRKKDTLGQKIATAFWEPKETKSEAPQETLFTTLLHPAPMNTLFTSTSLSSLFPLIVNLFLIISKISSKERDLLTAAAIELRERPKPSASFFQVKRRTGSEDENKKNGGESGPGFSTPKLDRGLGRKVKFLGLRSYEINSFFSQAGDFGICAHLKSNLYEKN